MALDDQLPDTRRAAPATRRARATLGWLAFAVGLGVLAAVVIALSLGATLRAVLSPFTGGVSTPACTPGQQDDDRAMSGWLRGALAGLPSLQVRPGCPAGQGTPPQVDVPLDLVGPADAALAAHGCTLTPVDATTRRAQDACTVQLPGGSFVLTRTAVPAGQTWITLARLP